MKIDGLKSTDSSSSGITVFIEASSLHDALRSSLTKALVAKGATVLALADALPGERLDEAAMINRCNVAVVIVDERSAITDNLVIRRLVERATVEEDLRLIPLVVDSATVPKRLSDFQHIAFQSIPKHASAPASSLESIAQSIVASGQAFAESLRQRALAKAEPAVASPPSPEKKNVSLTAEGLGVAAALGVSSSKMLRDFNWSTYFKPQEQHRRVEFNAAEYIEKSLGDLKKREDRERLLSFGWYGFGWLSLLVGVVFSVWRLFHAESGANWPRLVEFVFFGAVAVALLIALSKYAFSLGKGHMIEALKTADRSHAISFGAFYLRTFRDVDRKEVREVFQHWNIDRESAFSKQDASEFDPHLSERATELAKALIEQLGDKAPAVLPAMKNVNAAAGKASIAEGASHGDGAGRRAEDNRGGPTQE